MFLVLVIDKKKSCEKKVSSSLAKIDDNFANYF